MFAGESRTLDDAAVWMYSLLLRLERIRKLLPAKCGLKRISVDRFVGTPTVEQPFSPAFS